MEMKNLMCKLAGKKEALEENTKTLDVFRNCYNKGALETLSDIMEELEAVTGIAIEVKPEHRKVVNIDKQRMAR